MSLRILPLSAGRAHLPATAALLRQTWPAYYVSGPGDAVKTLTTRSGPGPVPTGWLALWEGQVAGTVAIEETSFGASPAEGPWLVGLAVRDDLRRRGIGLQLIKTASRDVAPLWTTTRSATGLMRQAGFAPQRRVEENGVVWQVLRRDGASSAPPLHVP
jgi:GNAT superfamily N-acetyltransferase